MCTCRCFETLLSSLCIVYEYVCACAHVCLCAGFQHMLWTERVMALFTAHYPVNKWQCEGANRWEAKFDHIIYSFWGKRCKVWISISNHILIINCELKLSFHSAKMRGAVLVDIMTLYNSGNIKMHEMGKKSEYCRKKKPFCSDGIKDSLWCVWRLWI